MGNNKVVKATAWYTLSSFVLKGIGIITTPIFARLLTTEEYGIINNFNTWLSIFTIICTLSLSCSLIRARFDYAKELNHYISTIIISGSIISSVIFLIIFSSESFWKSLLVLDTKYLVLMFITVIFNPAYDIFLQVERFNYRYKAVALTSIVIASSGIGLSFLFINLFNDSAFARVLGAQLPIIIAGIILYIRTIKTSLSFQFKYILYAVPMCIPYMIHLLSGTLLSDSDRIMITKICGAKYNGLYSMAYNVALIVNMIWNAMNSAFSPWLGEKLNDKEYDTIKKYSYVYISIFAILAIEVTLVAPELLLIIGGSKYIEAKYVIPPVMLSCIFIFAYSLYVNIEQFEKKTIGMALCTVTSALVNIGLNSIYIPQYGYIAAAYTTLFTYILMFIFHFLVVKKMHMTKCYNSWFVWGVCLVCSALTALILIIYENMLMRIGIGVAIFSVLLILSMKNRSVIKAFISSRSD